MPSVSEAYGALALGQPRLEKVICHTNVPGDALFQRYNRCPWRVVLPPCASTKTTSTSKRTANSKADTAADGSFSFRDHFDSTLNAGVDDRGLELDRGTYAEFRGSGGTVVKDSTMGGQPAAAKVESGESSPERAHNPSSEVIVDLSTRLVGRQGMVLEVGKDGSMVGVVLF